MMRPYEPLDAVKMDIREEDEMISTATLDAILKSPNGYGFSFVKDGEIGAVIGGAMMHEGVAQIFAIVNDIMRGHSISFTEASNGVIEMYAKEFNIHRFQCIVNPKIERNIKWINYLGFHRESTMKKISPSGQDMDMYARLFEVPRGTPEGDI